MKRNVELFLRKGIVFKKALPNDEDGSINYGEILILDPESPEQLADAVKVYTMYDHSFEKPAVQPDANSEVFFFMFPLEYITDRQPGVPSPMLAVNVVTQLKVMRNIAGVQTRHPCTTVLTVQSDPTNSYYQYGINDYGELCMFHTETKFKPWQKLILKFENEYRAPNDKKHYRICSPKLKKNKKVGCELLLLEKPEVDPDWEWVDAPEMHT